MLSELFNHADLERTLLWIVLLPMLGALINGIAGARASKTLVSAVAVGSVALAFLLSLVGFGYLWASEGEGVILRNVVYEWFSIDVGGRAVPVQVAFVMDHLSGVMVVMVTGIASLIHLYSTGYMADDPGYARFMTYLNLFTASMLILVLASNLPLMFVGWEGVGLCSYLLIGFWYTNKEYAAAGRKAFVVNRIGDFGVLIGMFILVASAQSFEFAEINEGVYGGALRWFQSVDPLPISIATAAALFLFLGCAGKSAQIPLYVWLPDAMAGPTPVSALIHAATMVTAGVYLCVRLSPVFVQSQTALAIIAIVGALTALLAASIALVQNQMKKILAYSTVSQLGFMFAAVGMGAFTAGFFHVFTHAFFKACLFLGAGSVMHAVHAHGDADIRYLGGLKKWMPQTHLTFLISTAAIAGFPLTAGFFSKDEILLGAATWATAQEGGWNGELGIGDNIQFGNWAGPWVGWFVFAILVLSATMTAFYMFRLYFKTFQGEFKGGHPPHEHGHEDADATNDTAHAHDGHDDHGAHAHEPHESPSSMTIPLIVLAIGAAFAGFLGLPHAFHLPNVWGEWLEPSVRHLTVNGETAHAHDWVAYLAMGAGTLAFLIGAGLAFVWYQQQGGAPAKALRSRFVGLHKFLMNKWYVDELYGATIVDLQRWFARFAANVDRFFVDGLLTRVSASGIKASGYVVTRSQNGVLYTYATLFVIGFAGLAWWFSYPHPALVGESPTAGTVRWQAGRGLGYQYRWDFDSDDEFDSDWSTENSVTREYGTGEDRPALHALVAVIEPRGVRAMGRDNEPIEIVLEQDEPVALDVVEDLSPEWQRRDPETSEPLEGLPSLRWTNVSEDGVRRAHVELRINGAAIIDGDDGDEGIVRLEPGDSIGIPGGNLTIAVRIRGTVQVRNPFGNIATSSEDVTVRVPRAPVAVADQEQGR